MKCHTTEERKEQDVDNAASQNTKALALWIDNMQGLKDVGFNAEFHPLVEVLYALNSIQPLAAASLGLATPTAPALTAAVAPSLSPPPATPLQISSHS
ncbi:MAG: hypothetical protein FRX48_05974 [Lasallia pustulata]|uniref:Uncharacterized protein n=1 Tax=Lasallia pustulata TaxID=136370 RepID=A0A5M8PPU8_9LECA|nr:MAG: hypothetical protein FRX48_05974 [Lasallia pustulata]